MSNVIFGKPLLHLKIERGAVIALLIGFSLPLKQNYFKLNVTIFSIFNIYS